MGRTHYKLDRSLSPHSAPWSAVVGPAFELKSFFVLDKSLEAHLHVARIHSYRVELEGRKIASVVEVGGEVKEIERE